MFGFKQKTAQASSDIAIQAPINSTPSPDAGKSFRPTRPFQLKIKAMSLGAEAKIIKAEERRLKRIGRMIFLERRLSLQSHRRGPVRAEARATHLARTFLSGKPYIAAEQRRWDEPDWDKAKAMAWKYGSPEAYRSEFEGLWKTWMEAGNAACIQLPGKPVA